MFSEIQCLWFDDLKVDVGVANSMEYKADEVEQQRTFICQTNYLKTLATNNTQACNIFSVDFPFASKHSTP